MKQIEYSKQALDFLRKISSKDACIIENKIIQYSESPESLQNNIKKLQGVALYRLRVGNYRVIFDEDGMVLYIELIGLRKNIYRELKKWQ